MDTSTADYKIEDVSGSPEHGCCAILAKQRSSYSPVGERVLAVDIILSQGVNVILR